VDDLARQRLSPSQKDAVEHANSEVVGIHASRSANRFEALEPVRQGVHRCFGAFARRVEADGDVMRHNLAYALIRASKILRGLRQALTERERYGVPRSLRVTSPSSATCGGATQRARRPLAAVRGSATAGGADYALAMRTSGAWNEEDYVFLTNSWHQAVGLISPWTTLHAFGGWKSMQPSQRWSPFGVP